MSEKQTQLKVTLRLNQFKLKVILKSIIYIKLESYYFCCSQITPYNYNESSNKFNILYMN
jgi:hypothetical protein